MSKNKDVNEVFDSIVENGLDFIEASVRDIEKNPKFSIAHFATGLELLLKARLFCEHWSLIALEPHKASWNNLKSGSVSTVQASSLCNSIAALTGKPLAKQAKIFKKVFDHRNRVLHFVAPPDLDATVAEQLTAWYHLHLLITREWSTEFSRHTDRIKQVESAQMENRKYLKARYEEKKDQLVSMAAGGHVIPCPSCNFEAAQLDSKDSPVTSTQCAVCLADFTVVTWGCGHWHVVEDTAQFYDCPCGKDHEIEEIVAKLDETSTMSPSEASSHGSGVYYCGECLSLEPRVVYLVNDGYVCLGCGQRFPLSEIDSCDYCSEQWVGYNMEDSYYRGCELCDGCDPD